MAIEVKIPELGESISEALIVRWFKKNGETVTVDEPLAELETDKASAELPSPVSGTLSIIKAEGETVQVGEIIASIDDSGAAAAATAPQAAKKTVAPPTPPTARVAPSDGSAPGSSAAPNSGAAQVADGAAGALSPAAKRLVEEHALDPASIRASGRGGRVTKQDVLAHIEAGQGVAAKPATPAAATPPPAESDRREPPHLSVVRPPSSAAAAASDRSDGLAETERKAMTPIRKRIGERLVHAQQTAAILTTFNEIDMGAVMDLRKRYKERFKEVHGVSLGFMSLFARACILALKELPAVNAQIDGTDIVYNNRVHLGIAASTERGLVVPVVRYADSMSLADIEREIGRLAEKARTNKLSLDDLIGGTFTISNGGVFGSMMSTPILNPPQSGILGMHKIEKRPVVVNDEIIVRPMMYVALSYDHRMIDGREAVTFLVRVKENIEDPERMLLGI